MAGSSGKRVTGTLLFLIAVAAVLAFYFIVFADAQQIESVPGSGNIGAVATFVAIVLVVALLGLIILLLMSRGAPAAPVRRERAEETFFVPPVEAEQTFTPAFEAVEDDLAVYNIWQLPVAQRSWAAPDDERTHSFYFPLNVESGVYVNDYIPLDDDADGPRLKMRTLLAGPPDVQAASFVIPEESHAWPSHPDPAEAVDAPRAWEPSARSARPERPAREELPGDHFMKELEGRFTGKSAPVAVTEDAEVYYDFRGDVHPVIEVEGIGTVYAEKLKQAGIETTARLCYEKTATIATKVGAPEKTVASWKAMAELMKVSGIGPQYAEALARAGITGIDELKRRSPARIAEQVNDFLESKDVTITGGTISERRVGGWQAAAKEMRRVRQSVPDQ